MSGGTGYDGFDATNVSEHDRQNSMYMSESSAGDLNQFGNSFLYASGMSQQFSQPMLTSDSSASIFTGTTSTGIGMGQDERQIHTGQYSHQQPQQIMTSYDDMRYSQVTIDDNAALVAGRTLETGEGGEFGAGVIGGMNGETQGVGTIEAQLQQAHQLQAMGASGLIEEEEEEEDPRYQSLPRILLMGPRRSGKTSIQRVVFDKMSPHETLFRLEATQHVERTIVDHTPLCRFTIWDFPGDYYHGNASHHNSPMPSVSSSPYVYADYDQFQVQQPPQQNRQYPMSQQHPSVDLNNYNSTSIRGIGGALDQQDQVPTAEDIAIFRPPQSKGGGVAGSGGTTALVFVMDAQDEPYDHVLRNFISTISRAVAVNPNSLTIEIFINKVDGELFLSDEAKYDCRRDIMQQVTDELAEAQLDHFVVSVNYHLVSIYDHSIFEALSRVIQKVMMPPYMQPTLENICNTLVGSCSMEKAYLFDVASKLYISTDSSPVDMQSVELCSDMIDVVLDVSGIYGTYSTSISKNHGHTSHSSAVESDETKEDAVTTDGVTDNGGGNGNPAYDEKSASVIRLSNGMVLYLKEVDTMLALVCLSRSEHFRKKALVDYNIGCFKRALKELTVATSSESSSNLSQENT